MNKLGIVFGIVLSATLAACGGGGGGGAAPPPGPPGGGGGPTPTPPPLQPATSTIVTAIGATNGTPDQFTPHTGDTATGGQGQTVDGMPCAAVMYDNGYHVHAYLGVYVNNSLVALPPGVGMKNPAPPDARGFIDSGDCFYYTHIHDRSGYVHIEDINTGNAPITASLRTLGNLLDVWGLTVNANQFGQFSGPVRIYTSGPVFRGGGGAALDVPWTTYTLYTGDPHNIPIYSHEVIFVLVGPTFPTSLPNVHFYSQF